MNFDDKLRLLKSAPDVCGYARLGRDVAEEADIRLSSMEIACRVYARSIEKNRAYVAATDDILDLLRRADLIINDLLLMCHSRALNIDLPDIDAWIEDSRGAINRSIDESPPAVDGWIPWYGGERPVSAGTMVLTRFRNGKTEVKPFRAGSYQWGHPWDAGDPQDTSLDIVAYKVVR